MNPLLVDQIADAVLYEGYVLYPYRPSVKNHQRWTFGALVPRAYSEATAGSDAWRLQTECLVRGDDQTTLQVRVRFLHLLARRIWELETPQPDLGAAEEPVCRAVESLEVAGQLLRPWQEASERSHEPELMTLGALAGDPWRCNFTFAASRLREPVRTGAGMVAGLIVREQHAVAGALEIAAARPAPGVFKLRVAVENQSPILDAGEQSRDHALLRSLVTTHLALGVRQGEFISLLDPPPELHDSARGCQNVGVWPVLVGQPGDKDTMLAAPIILYDYPQIAAESPGDLFDATEIDEILTLRIQTLTDAEKKQAAAVDDRVRALLARTETLARDQLQGLHGTMRGWRVLSDGVLP